MAPESADAGDDTGQAKKDGDLNRAVNENDMIESLNSPIPIRILKRSTPIKPVDARKDRAPSSPDPVNGSPATPPSTPSPGKNYHLLYLEVTKRLFEQTEAGNKRYLELEAAHKELRRKYKEETKTKDARILHLQTKLGQITESRDEERADHDTSLQGLRKVIMDNEKSMAEMEDKLKEKIQIKPSSPDHDNNEDTCAAVSTIRCLKRNDTTGEIFRNKAKKRTNASPELTCEFTGCENDNVDMVKCNTCDRWVCEDCNDVPVAKLKVVMNKCKSVFFICKECEARLGETPEVTTHKKGSTDELVSVLTKVFESKVKDVETKFTNIIEKKLGEKLELVNKINENNANSTVAPEINKTYAKVLEVPMELRKIMKEAKNNERVEETEVEKRARNFVIHGAEEIGENADEITKNDAQYIEDILKKLGVPGKSGSITRLGQPNDKKKRPIKIVMQTNTEKDQVMANLRQLKGTETDFGKISITNDHTKTERDQIREMSEKAKEKSKDDKVHIYKVRGDPKNGLRLVPFPRQ